MSNIPTVPGSEPVMIPLDLLTPDSTYQPRAAGLSEAHIRLLMKSGASAFPRKAERRYVTAIIDRA